MKRSPLIDTLLAMETPARLKALRGLSDEEKREIRHHWPAWARDEQLPPQVPDWRLWLILAGRGFGKTRAGAEWIRRVAETTPNARIALVAASLGEARAVMVEGESGLLAVAPPGRLPLFEPSLRRLAFGVIDAIAAQALNGLMGQIGGGKGGGLLGGALNLGGLIGSILGLPGRATGGPVAPNRGYLVGERGPELFVPTSAGRIETGMPGTARDVKVSITIASPPGSPPADSPACTTRRRKRRWAAIRPPFRTWLDRSTQRRRRCWTRRARSWPAPPSRCATGFERRRLRSQAKCCC